jgi:hypothetical protein
MIKLAGIGHVLLRVADEEASKRFYRDVLGFSVAEQDPEHGGVFMTLGDGFHTLDITQHPSPQDAAPPQRGQLGLVHIVFKVGSYAAFREPTPTSSSKVSRSSAPSTMFASAAFISPIPTATASRSTTRCRGRCSCFPTAVAMRTSACRSPVSTIRSPAGSARIGPGPRRWRRLNVCGGRPRPCDRLRCPRSCRAGERSITRHCHSARQNMAGCATLHPPYACW